MAIFAIGPLATLVGELEEEAIFRLISNPAFEILAYFFAVCSTLSIGTGYVDIKFVEESEESK